MSKYPEEFKIKVVKAYLSKEGGTKFLAKKYNVAILEPSQWYELAKNKNPRLCEAGHSANNCLADYQAYAR